MKHSIECAQQIGDGILVTFRDGTACFFSADFLGQHVGAEATQVFLSYDPSPMQPLCEDAALAFHPVPADGVADRPN